MAERFLIVKLSAIGDVLMATPMARALRKARPDSYIAWVVESKAAEVLAGNPDIDELIIWRRKKGVSFFEAAKEIRNLVVNLRKTRFDVAFDAQGLMKSALASVASGAKLRVGYSDSDEMSGMFYNRRWESPHSLSAQQRYLDLLRAVGVESTDVAMTMPLADADREYARDFYQENGLMGRRVVALIPATTRENKHWKVESWSELIDMLEERHGAKGILMGARADADLAEKIASGCSNKPVSAVGRTTIKQAAAILDRADLSVAVCTGLLHASLALGKPTIGLFGPSVWRTFADRPDFIRLTRDMPCSPCHRRPTCEGFPCIWGITPEEVADAAAPYLQGR